MEYIQTIYATYCLLLERMTFWDLVIDVAAIGFLTAAICWYMNRK